MTIFLMLAARCARLVEAYPWLDRMTLWLAAFVLFLSTRAQHLSISHDSIFYMTGVRDGTWHSGFHPHHLLFQPFMVAMTSLLGALSDASVIMRIEGVNAFVGATGAALLYMMCTNRLQMARSHSLAAVCTTCLSYGYWYHSVCIEVVMIPLVLFTGCLYVALGDWHTRSTPVAAGILHALSIVFHQVYVFQGIALVCIAVMRGESPAERLRFCGRYLLASVPLVIALYGFALVVEVRPESPAAAYRWLTAYAYIGTEANTHYNPPSLRTPLEIAVGETRALTGLISITKSEIGSAIVRKAFPSKHIEDEEYITRTMNPVVALAVFLLSGAVCVYFCVV
ncbi:MAG: hypothetical protein JNL32_15255, partial [Candidatus Kapabacteria bacterium]|nr:hypothetical protein [Candidatus Kapabacteria bacterium]